MTRILVVDFSKKHIFLHKVKTKLSFLVRYSYNIFSLYCMALVTTATDICSSFVHLHKRQTAMAESTSLCCSTWQHQQSAHRPLSLDNIKLFCGLLCVTSVITFSASPASFSHLDRSNSYVNLENCCFTGMSLYLWKCSVCQPKIGT